MSHDALRERLAVVLAHSAHLGSDEQATDAIKCVETWLSDRKLRVVPEEATDGMCEEAGDALHANPDYHGDAWDIMVKAAPSNRAALTGKDDQ